ncbi:hypothetical protein SD70_31590 [Gordoniibacillus kamchatkensis]|uniref:Uncharacterized protein n=1 Tax=Gordoniibacillus kamchatkensis TaxID=1590651 RepID=A0ABR5A705_9BACL|nr:hypothetical protein SD70_31590 [Paenibacillus sp. VKM B-2647]
MQIPAQESGALRWLSFFGRCGLDLREVMAELVYYDYAHFSKAFKLCICISLAQYQHWMQEMAASFRNTGNVVFYKTGEGGACYSRLEQQRYGGLPAYD